MRFLLLLIPATLGAQSATFFHHVRVFDGERVSLDRDVLVQNGAIVRVGTSLTAARERWRERR